MPQTIKNAKEINDPVIEAAMLETPDEDEETKKLRKDLLGEDEDPKEDSKPEDEDDSEDAPEDSDDSDDDEDEDEDSDEDDSKDDPAKPDPKKPVEADDDPEEDEEERKTRKEKRQERKESYLQSIRKDHARDLRDPEIPEYQPLKYDAVDEEGNPLEFKPEDLAKDREMVGAVGFAKGAVEARKAVEQDNFWNELKAESKIISYDPALSILSEEKPDGTPNPNFDPDQAEFVNERYLQTIGYKEHYQTDPQGNLVMNPQTGRPILIKRTVDRTDISYEKFARKELQQIEKLAKKYIDEQEDDTRTNIITQRKNQGVRPGSGKRKSLGTLQAGDIANMSDEDFEKHEDAIQAKILSELGQ